jgi:hypothetical protein
VFTYDPASQIVLRTASNDAYGWAPPGSVDRGYRPNALNQYDGVTEAGEAEKNYLYDLNGKLQHNGALGARGGSRRSPTTPRTGW